MPKETPGRTEEQHPTATYARVKRLAETALQSEGLDPAAHPERYAELRSMAARLLRHWFEEGGKPPKKRAARR